MTTIADVAGIAAAITGTTAISLFVRSALVVALPLLWCLARRMSAAGRHLILAASFAGLAILPLAVAWGPRVSMPIPEWTRSMHGTPLWDPASGTTSISADAAVSLAGSEAPAPIAARLSADEWLFVIWSAGACACLLPLVAGLWQTRRIRVTSAPWNGDCVDVDALAGHRAGCARVRVRVHAGAAVPMTFGGFRPVVVLPIDASTWRRDDLTRALTHELAHVRRCDWPVHCFSRAVAAAYWFNPFVWIAWRRLRLEAERACDDVVVGACDRFAYADQLVVLASRLRSRIRPMALLLAMAGRTDLSARITSMLDDTHRRERVQGRHVAAAIGAAVMAVLAVSSIGARDRSEVDAASSVTPAPPIAANDPGFAVHPDWRVSAQAGGLCAPWGAIRPSTACLWTTGMTLRELATFAFSPSGFVPPLLPIAGGPAWANTDRFDVVLRADGNDPFALPARSRWAAMMHDVLVQRFALMAHHETRSLPTYVLTARGGALTTARVRPASPACVSWAEVVRTWTAGASPRVPPVASPPTDACRSETSDARLESGAMTMSQLAWTLSNRVGRMVSDATGVSGMFAVDLAWNGTDAASLARTLADAGLDLEPAMGPVDVLVIDRASRPARSDARPLDAHS